MAHYDYIIIGAGSAGCVMANRLGEDRDISILVLEAGPMDHKWYIHLPAGVYKAWVDEGINWNYQTAPQTHMNNQQIPIPRGRVIGGSSSINSMVYMRGHPLDYDGWAKVYDLPQWSYAHCLPYFKAGESWSGGVNPWRGGDGPLGVTRGMMENPLFDAFLAAGESAGLGRSDDLNGHKPEGMARLDATIRNGRRCSAAVAHLRPALKRGNVHLKTNAQVAKIDITNQRATSVQYRHNGHMQTVTAEREIILCGGAINSPQTLMLSGIGPADHLKSCGITPIHHLPGVGQNLQDHLDVVMQYRCLEPITWHKIGNPLRKVGAGLKWLAGRKGIVASNIWEAGGLVRGNQSAAYPNLQYHFAPIGVDYDGSKIKLVQAFQFHLSQLRQKSRGHIALSQQNPHGAPLLHFNFLSVEQDLDELVEGVELTRQLANQPAFGQFRGEEVLPGPNIKSASALKDWIRAEAVTEFHPSCSCRMGHDEMAVVDDALKVHGIEGLRVVDASVMPNVISANLNAPVQMIAARAADFIANKPQLAPENPGYHFN